MSDPKAYLLKLHKNLNVLREREAKHAGNPPLELVNQIDDHQAAIDLTEQTIRGELGEAEWREALGPLLVDIRDRGEAEAECHVDIGDVDGDIIGAIIAGRDITAEGDIVTGVKLTTTVIHEAPTPSLPLQLPTRAQHFTNRRPELTQLLQDLHPTRIITLTGPGGIGKTALAAEALRQLAPGDGPPDRFPDGVIFYSFYGKPNPALALEHIVRSFDETARDTSAEAARRVLSGKRALLILDGTEATSDLRTVLEVRGNNCGVLVTSRRRKDAAAERQAVEPLESDEAVTLLRAWGKGQTADEAAARHICELVGRLPLAVRLVGRYLDETEETAAEYLEWLATTPIQALSHGEHREESVDLLLARSLEQVSEETRQVLAVVGLLALSPFGREVVGKALEVPAVKAGRLLGELVNYGLLLRTGSHYEVSHALVHTYAHRRMDAGEAARRVAAYYTALAEEQSKLGLEGYARLDGERAHIMAVLAGCVEREDWEAGRSLVWAVDGYLNIQGHWTERVAAIEAGVTVAVALGNRRDEGAFLIKMGLVSNNLGRVTQAIGFYEQALVICREIGHRQDEGNALGNLGNAYAALGQVDKAIEFYQQALVISREIGDRRGEGTRLRNLGSA